jgi:hypothetical protein
VANLKRKKSKNKNKREMIVDELEWLSSSKAQAGGHRCRRAEVDIVVHVVVAGRGRGGRHGGHREQRQA